MVVRETPQFPHHDATIDIAFATTAERCAGNIAVIANGREITYDELAGVAGGITEALGPTGDEAPPVGLLLEHGVDMIAGQLGVLASGECYVPLDPTYPRERLRVMAEQARIRTIVTRGPTVERAREIAPTARIIDLATIRAAAYRPHPIDAGRPAYVLFTSGSTGVPKGVVHSHRSVLHGISNHVVNLGIGASDRTSLLTSFGFDMAVSDLYSALLTGAAVVPVDLRSKGFGELARALDDGGVTVYHSTPTVFRSLVDALGPDGRLSTIRVVVLGGEQVSRTDLHRARRHCAPDCLFVNGYGATEASFAVQNHIAPGDALDAEGESLPIGLPLRGYEIELLDDGEIVIHSDHLALGYLGDPERTAERFGPDGRSYRTGDLARRLADGRLLYLGRSDRQVKVRGHRVELGEIEAQLSTLPGVRRAVVAPDRDRATLVAYVRPDGPIDPAQLRDQLAAKVPDFLVPQRFIVVEELPMTTTGKVDVDALTAAEPVPPRRALGLGQPPQGELERLVADLWCELLDLETVGRNVAFFDAGGDSVHLARLQPRLTRLAGTEISLLRLFERPTVAGMAALLADGGTSGASPAPMRERMARRRAARARGRAS